MSRAVGDALIRRGTPKQKLTVIPNGVVTARIDVPVSDAAIGEWKARIGWEPGRRTIGIVARPKDQEVVLRALPDVRTPVRLVLAGVEPQSRLGQLARSVAAPHKVVCLAFTPEVRPLYDLLDLVMLPSESEGLSQALLEAMALGKPVIASASTGNLDLVTDGVDGRLVSPKTPRAWAAAIDELLTDAGLARRLGTAARRTARETFGLGRTVARTTRAVRVPAPGSAKAGLTLAPVPEIRANSPILESALPENPVVKVSGFTIVRNAVKLDFPLEASIRSILPICDEVVVNVGRSDDDTLEVVRSIGDPKIRILETEWDMTRRNWVFGDETLKAMRACRFPWGVYIQADEVLHEDGARELYEAIQRNDADPRVEGLLVRYLHFYGGLDTIATHRRWYRREVRVVRLDPALDIRPYQGAQGFRVGPELRKIRSRLTGAVMYHYGWGRPARAIHAKREVTRGFFPDKQPEGTPLLPWIPLLRPFHGAHPAVAQEWVEQRRNDPERRVAPRRLRLLHLRFYLSHVIERLTGVRVFEFRNYKRV